MKDKKEQASEQIKSRVDPTIKNKVIESKNKLTPNTPSGDSFENYVSKNENIAIPIR